MEVGEILAAIRVGYFPNRDLVRISHALAQHSAHTRSLLGQYGEELVTMAYSGQTGSFDQKGYDVVTADGEELQVKTYSKGKWPGNIKTFTYDVHAACHHSGAGSPRRWTPRMSPG